jgi:hypothetical protein
VRKQHVRHVHGAMMEALFALGRGGGGEEEEEEKYRGGLGRRSHIPRRKDVYVGVV